MIRVEQGALPYRHAVASRGAPNEGVDVKGIIKLVRRRLALITVVVLALTGGTALIAFNLTPQYQSVSAVLIEPRPRLIIDPNLAADGFPQKAEGITTQIALLQSLSYAEKAIQALDLLNDPKFSIARSQEPDDGASGVLLILTKWLPEDWWTPDAANAKQASDGQALSDNEGAESSGLWSALDGAVSRLLEIRDLLLGDSTGPESPMTAPAAQRPHDKMAVAAAILLDGLDVQQFADTQVIEISYTSEDAETAARIANELAEIYVRDQLRAKQTANNRASEWLSKRISELRDQLLKSEAAVETYSAEQGLYNAQGVRLSEQHVATINQALITAHAERVERETQFAQVLELRWRGGGLESVPEIMNSPIITDLRRQQTALLREEALLSQEYGPRHPRLLRVRADAHELAAKIQAAENNVVLGLERQVVAARAREEMLAADLQLVRNEAATQNQADVQLRMLQREAEANRALYATFLSRFKELSGQQSLLEAGVRVVSRATVADVPNFPRPKLMIAAGFTGSLMLGIMLAFVRDHLDSGLRSTQQVEQLLGLAFLGCVPRMKGVRRRGGPLTYLVKRPQSAYAEAIRAVQTALHLLNDDPPRAVLVTSSVPGEGKTTLALSLAALAAGSGRKTIIVDLDLRRPRVARTLDYKTRGAGLVEHLMGEASLNEAIHAAPYGLSLDFLPVRRLAANPTDLLASYEMGNLVDELRHRYHYVILDSAPILGISDTKVAVRLADAVVLAVQWGKTKDQVALNGLGALFERHADVAGAVLTQVDLRRHAKYGFDDVAQSYGKFKKYYMN